MTEPTEFAEKWEDITPQEAKDRMLDLSVDLTISAPLNEEYERCPWPWEPQQLQGVPLGQYHCGYCGAMVVAGLPHPDYAGIWEQYDEMMRKLADEGELKDNGLG